MNKRTKRREHIVFFFSLTKVDLVSLWDFAIATFHAG